MDTPLRDYHLRPPSRFKSQKNFEGYIDKSEYNDSRESLAPPRGRSSTPSAAVRRAMEVLDETYRQQSYLKNDRWSRSADQGSVYARPFRARHSPSPIRSRSQSPIRSLLNSSPHWSPRVAEMEKENFLGALDDSESRREILLKKLADAQRTMEVQSERVRSSEMDINEARATIRLLQQVQQELETKIQFLQKDKDTFVAKTRQEAEDREIQRRKMDDLARESNRLRCQLDLMLADKEQHHVTLEHLHKSINDLKDHSKNATELQVVTNNDLDATKERLSVSKQRCELLEKEKNHAFSELEKNQKAHQALINRNTDLGQRLTRCQHDLKAISEKFDKTHQELEMKNEELGMCREKLRKQDKDITDLRKSHCEMQEVRERAVKYNQELEKTVCSIKDINQELKEARVTLEDDLTSLHADLAKTRLELAKVTEQNTSNRVHLKESQKNCKELSSELGQLHPRVDDLTNKIKELEGTHKLDVQQMSLLEAQKTQINRAKEDLTTRLSAQQESYNQFEKHHNEEVKKLNQQLMELRHERDKTSSRCRDLESQSSQIKEELATHTQHSKVQLEHWKQACSKLTLLVEEKDEDIRESVNLRREAEDNYALSEAQKRALERQLNEIQISQDELNRLRIENKQLTQERVENQQMITVLEMQRDIMATSPSKQNQPAADVTSKLQVENLQAEVSLLKAKLQQTEAERDNKTLILDSSINEKSNNNSREVGRLQGMNQTLVQEHNKLRQEVETLQNLLDEKEKNYDRDFKRLDRERQQLELRMSSMSDEANALKSNQLRNIDERNSEIQKLQSETTRLKQTVEERDQQVMIMKGECVILENEKKRAEERVKTLQSSLEERAEKGDAEEKLEKELEVRSAKLEAINNDNATLRARTKELDDLRSAQQNMIEMLTKQLENYTNSSGESDEPKSIPPTSPGREIKWLKRDLKRAIEDIKLRDKQLMDLKRKFSESKKLEKKTRQERDELQGKTIIMESLNASSEDVIKELDKVREDKANLEQQLNLLVLNNSTQSPPTSITDDKQELEKQYHLLCERHTWLEKRTESLEREIELMRDQNSLLQEQRNNAEREASNLRENMKALQMASKGSRRQWQSEQIHLQHTNAENMQKISELERELSEKSHLIQAIEKEIHNMHRKKPDRARMSNLLDKIRRSSDNGESKELIYYNTPKKKSRRTPRRSGFNSSPNIGSLKSSPTSINQPRRSSSLSPKWRSSSAREYTKDDLDFSKSNEEFEPTLSPSFQLRDLTQGSVAEVNRSYVINFDEISPGERSWSKSPEGPLSSMRVCFDEGSEQETGSTSSPGGESKLSSNMTSSRREEEAKEDDDRTFYANDYIPGPSNIPSPDQEEPHPESITGLPTPTSSPSLPSPSSSRKLGPPVYVVAGSDESEESETVISEENDTVTSSSGQQSPPILVKSPFSALFIPGSNNEQQHSLPPRPQSQPTFKDFSLSPVVAKSKKKRSSLV